MHHNPKLATAPRAQTDFGMLARQSRGNACILCSELAALHASAEYRFESWMQSEFVLRRESSSVFGEILSLFMAMRATICHSPKMIFPDRSMTK
jgi:hypothetical protein